MMAAVVRGREGAAVELGLVAVAVDIIHPDGPRVPRERRGVPAPPRGAPAAEPELAADHGGVLPPEAVVTHGAPLALTADLDTAAAGLGRGREADRRGARGHVAVVPWRGGHARGARLARAARGGDAAVGVAPAEAVVDAARARARLRPRRACPAGHLGAGGVGVTARLALAHAARLRGGLRRAHGARGLLALVQAHERACGALAACDVVGAVGGHGARRAHLARGRPLVEHEVVVGGAVAVPDGAAARGGVAVGGARGARALVREEALRAPAVRQLRGGVQDRVVRLEERGALRAEARGVAADGRVFGVPAVVLRVVGALEQRRLRPRARHVVHPDGPGAAVERRPRARAPDAPAHQPELPAHHLRVNLRPAVVAHVPPLPELEHHDGAAPGRPLGAAHEADGGHAVRQLGVGVGARGVAGRARGAGVGGAVQRAEEGVAAHAVLDGVGPDRGGRALGARLARAQPLREGDKAVRAAAAAVEPHGARRGRRAGGARGARQPAEHLRREEVLGARARHHAHPPGGAGAGVGGAGLAPGLPEEEVGAALAVGLLRGVVQVRRRVAREHRVGGAEGRGVAAHRRVLAVPAVMPAPAEERARRDFLLSAAAAHVVHPDDAPAVATRVPARAERAAPREAEGAAHNLGVAVRKAVVTHSAPLARVHHLDAPARALGGAREALRRLAVLALQVRHLGGGQPRGAAVAHALRRGDVAVVGRAARARGHAHAPLRRVGVGRARQAPRVLPEVVGLAVAVLVDLVRGVHSVELEVDAHEHRVRRAVP
mmetsp:Transcript_41183/g.97618  ORF Transcript_41183/g.97618 Transcript_41183/m.97618 type:complete len:779 (-) Transcript_41183:1057-3393(-)